MVLMRLAWQS